MENFYSGLLGFNFFIQGGWWGGGDVKGIVFYLLKVFFLILQ